MDFNENGLLRKTFISSEAKTTVERVNQIKESITKVTTKVKKLVGAFNHNEGLVRRLREKQIQLHYECKIKLIQDMPVRWCSLFNCLDSVFINKDALKSLALEVENSTIKEHVPSDLEFHKIDEYCDLPVKDLTTQLGGSKYTTASLLFPAINYLIKHELPSKDFETYEIQALNDELIKSLKSRFQYLEEVDVFLAATFLHFQYKKFDFIQDAKEKEIKLSRAKEFVIAFHKEHFEKESEDNESTLSMTTSKIVSTAMYNSNSSESSMSESSTSSDSSSTPFVTNNNKRRSSKNNSSSTFMDKLMGQASIKSSSSHHIPTPLEVEIENYVNLNVTINNKDKDAARIQGALYFYKIYQRSFPALAKVAKSLLSITTTSVPSECLFSKAGLIETD